MKFESHIHIPRSAHELLDPANAEEVGAAFRIGDPNSTIEMISHGHRYLIWDPSERADALKDIAGWGSLPHHIEQGYAYIEVPEGTRSASSVLGGVEAWKDEKANVIDFISGYALSSYQRSNKVDTSVTLDKVAVTKEAQVFITPPHTQVGSPELIIEWLAKLTRDTQNVLANDPNRNDLLNRLLRINQLLLHR